MASTIENCLRNQTHQTYTSTAINQIDFPLNLEAQGLKSENS